MIEDRILMLEHTLLMTYGEEFTELCGLIRLRSSYGFYDTRVEYKNTKQCVDMVNSFHSYFVMKDYTVETGTNCSFPYIKIRWD